MKSEGAALLYLLELRLSAENLKGSSMRNGLICLMREGRRRESR